MALIIRKYHYGHFILLAFVLRLVLLLFPSLHEMISNRLEFSTRVTSVQYLKENIFLYINNIPLYNFPCMHPPILIWLMSKIPFSLFPLIYFTLDFLIALGLYSIAIEYKRDSKSTIWTPDPILITLVYLYNPFSITAFLSQSSIYWSHMGIVYSLLFSLKGWRTLAIGLGVFSSFISIYPFLLLIPLFLFQYQRFSIYQVIDFTLTASMWSCFYLTLSFILTGSFDFIYSAYLSVFSVEDLTPNIGIYWYLFMEMFGVFRMLFLIIVHAMSFFILLPLSIRFRSDPMFIFTIYLAVISLLKEYPSLNDLSLSLSFVPFVLPPIITYTNKLLISVSLFAYGVVLGPIFHYYWIYQGSGNANFYYAATLAHAASQIIFIIDIIKAKLDEELYTNNEFLVKEKDKYVLVHK